MISKFSPKIADERTFLGRVSRFSYKYLKILIDPKAAEYSINEPQIKSNVFIDESETFESSGKFVFVIKLLNDSISTERKKLTMLE